MNWYRIKENIAMVKEATWPDKFALLWCWLWNPIAWRLRWVFAPYNRLRVRNLPRSYMDRDWIMLHAAFSILCDFVERECGGAEGMRKDIAWRVREDDHWAVPNAELLRIYEWYCGVDWDDPVPFVKEQCEISWVDREKAFNKTCEDNLVSLMKIRGYMWT